MELDELKSQALAAIIGAKTIDELEKIRVKYLGRKGELTNILRSLKDLSDEEKRLSGPKANSAREGIEAALAERRGFLIVEGGEQEIDLTFPGQRMQLGHLHPLTLIEQSIRKIFTELNFAVVEGPEVEIAHYNFDALNIPESHPARDMWDTFWLKASDVGCRMSDASTASDIHPPSSILRPPSSDNLLLRTHTSPMQIRYMESHEPPFQIIVPGRVFRYEAINASHQINFHQVEGLMVGPDVSLANFKYIITEFLHRFFGGKLNVRIRPSYFPFVEPGLEIDIQRKSKLRRPLAAGSESPDGTVGGWLEVMGAGMVHPNVFDAVKYNPKFVKGFAFGLGIERMAMLKYGIPDIRMFYENDTRFLKQF